MKLKVAFAICSVAVSFFAGLNGSANVGEMFGFGARMSALGGAGVADGLDSFTAYYNPAGLSLDSDKRLLFSWGIVLMQPSFNPISNVVTQNNFNADTPPNSPSYSDVDNSSYRNTFGQEIGLSYRLTDGKYNPTAGLVLFLPLDQVAFFDTGESYVPEYVLYRSRTQRPQIEIGGGVKVGRGFHLGAGVHFGFSLTSNASVFINTKSNTTSSMRFLSTFKTKASPYLGLLFTPEEAPKYSLGAVFRFPVSSDNTMTLNTAARAFGDLAAIDFNFNAFSTLFYDPMSLELGGKWQHAERARLLAQLDYQFWSSFQPPALQIQQPQTTMCDPPGACSPSTIQISPTILPSVKYVNILIPRVGEEIQISNVSTFRMGYAYRPSILAEIPNGSGNYLDPPKHMFNLGWGLSYKHFLGYPLATRIDFNLSYQALVTQYVTKATDNLNEAGQEGYRIGYPGYNVGGSIYGGGITLALAF